MKDTKKESSANLLDILPDLAQNRRARDEDTMPTGTEPCPQTGLGRRNLFTRIPILSAPRHHPFRADNTMRSAPTRDSLISTIDQVLAILENNPDETGLEVGSQ